jgi:hypothetical protein
MKNRMNGLLFLKLFSTSLSCIVPILGHADIFAPVTGTDLLLGSGYNSLSGESGADCIERTTLLTGASNPVPSSNTVCSASGQCVDFDLSKISSAKDLRSALGLDAKASFGFGPYSGEASFSYFEDNKFTENNLYIFVKVKVTNLTERLSSFNFTQDAHNLLASDPAQFLESCGDTFISARTTGGEFTAVIKIETTSEQNKRDIDVKLRASGISWSANASVESALTKISHSNNVSVKMFKRGGIGSLPAHDDIQTVFDFARRFPVLVQNSASPIPYLLTSTSYKAVLGRPQKNTSLLKQTKILEKIAENRDVAFESWGSVDFILMNPKQFESFKLNDLQKYRSDLDGIVKELYQAAEDCEIDPANCALPAVTWPVMDLPNRLARDDSKKTKDDKKEIEKAKAKAKAKAKIKAEEQRNAEKKKQAKAEAEAHSWNWVDQQLGIYQKPMPEKFKAVLRASKEAERLGWREKHYQALKKQRHIK